MDAFLSRRRSSIGRAKPKIQIDIDGQDENNFVPAFTTHDDIKGCVQIDCEAPLKFTEIYITFEGYVKTKIEKQTTGSAVMHKEDGYHLIIRLMQPMDEGAFPRERVLQPFKPYRIPFHFVVPEHTIPKHCDHPKIGIAEDAHLALPPSIGDPAVSTYGRTLMDDMCPESARVVYQIKARVSESLGRPGLYKTLVDSSKKVCICPAVEEAPPLKVDGGNQDDYCLRQERSIYAGTFRPRIGRFTAEAAQPSSLRMPSIRSRETCPIMTQAIVNLRFDPAKGKDNPPKVTAVSTKIRVATAYGTHPFHGPVSKASDFITNWSQSLYTEGVPLSSREMANVDWRRQSKSENPSTNDPVDRRQKAPTPSKDYLGDDFFTAKIQVPIELPTGRKLFVPTFNSCLICRLYILYIYVNIEQPKATLKDPNLLLKLPLQITCDPNPEAHRRFTSRQANAIATRMTADFFTGPETEPPPDISGEHQIGLTNGHAQNPTEGETEANASPTDRDEKEIMAEQSQAQRSASYSDGMHTLAHPQELRLLTAQNRTDSLMFVNEEAGEEPPGYQAVAGRWRSNTADRRASEGGGH